MKYSRYSTICLLVILISPSLSTSQIGWSPAINCGPNINTANLEDGHSLSGDSLKFYIASDRPGGLGASDIWVSVYSNGWQPATNLGGNINSPYQEYEPYISSDGIKLYFSSYRPGGMGGSDIWISEFTGGSWQPAYNLASINTAFDETCPCVSNDNTRLYFASDRPGGQGQMDIWVSHDSGGSWQPSTNLGAIINTIDWEYSPFITYDNQALYFGSDRPGGFGGFDVWVSENIGGSWHSPINVGSNINTSVTEVCPIVSSNGMKLYFAADSWGGGYGEFDIWFSVWQGAVSEKTNNKPIRTMTSLPTIISGPLNLTGMDKYAIWDIMGRKMMSNQIKPGIYFIEIDGAVIRKIVKIR